MTPPPVSGDRIARAAATAAALLVVAFALVVALKLPDGSRCPTGTRPVISGTAGVRRTVCQTDPRTSGGVFHPPVRPVADRHVGPRLLTVALALTLGWLLLRRPHRGRAARRRSPA